MGIRYYAYPVDGSLIEQARAEPLMFLSPDPLMDAWGGAGDGWARSHSEPRAATFTIGEVPESERPRMLYLDKTFSVLQQLFRGRPSYNLVAGAVRPCGMGWDPWIEVLGPDEVADIARDVVLIDPVADGDAALDGPMNWDAETINSFVVRAQQFVTELATEGKGLVYMIG